MSFNVVMFEASVYAGYASGRDGCIWALRGNVPVLDGAIPRNKSSGKEKTNEATQKDKEDLEEIATELELVGEEDELVQYAPLPFLYLLSSPLSSYH
jgi:hypothetical protein